jgi:hypothetical protein
MDEVEPGGASPAPAVGWATGPLGGVQSADREIARQTARRARAVAEFAATRPASEDRQPEQPGSMSADRRAGRPEVLADVSEWAGQELAVALSITSKAAEDLLTRSLTLVHRLPGTLAALESGVLHPGHLWPLLEKVAPVPDRVARARLERDLLRWVTAREVTTPAQLGAKIGRELLARNVRSAARDLEAALRRRGLYARPDRVDGMAVLSALMTVPEADALLDALGRYADALDDGAGPARTKGQKMVDCLLDLVLRPGEASLPPVQAQLTLVAPVTTVVGGDAPGEVGGQPVPAEMVRALARALGLLPDVAPQEALAVDTPSPGAADEEDLAGDAALEHWWAEVEERALRGEWGGEERPPPDELERLWRTESRWQEDGRDTETLAEKAHTVDEQHGSAAAESCPEWWSAADSAVEAASASLLELDRRMARARRAVGIAEIADGADEHAREQSPAAALTVTADAITALAHAAAEQRAALAQLLDRTGGGGLADRPRIALTDALTGALLALTDAGGLRLHGTCGEPACRRGRVACSHDLSDRPGLGPPPQCATYRPGAELDRFVRTRDRRCRFPGCRRRVPRGGELDHHERWPDGPTSAGNLTGFCTGHHRGKHQAPGWRYTRSSDGTMTVRTPTGLLASTGPPPF